MCFVVVVVVDDDDDDEFYNANRTSMIDIKSWNIDSVIFTITYRDWTFSAKCFSYCMHESPITGGILNRIGFVVSCRTVALRSLSWDRGGTNPLQLSPFPTTGKLQLLSPIPTEPQFCSFFCCTHTIPASDPDQKPTASDQLEPVTVGLLGPSLFVQDKDRMTE